MTTVFILLDDCPTDFSERCIIAVYSSAQLAKAAMNKLKVTNHYRNQYLTVVPKIVKES